MFPISLTSSRFFVRRAGAFAFAGALLIAPVTMRAQFAPPPTTQVHEPAALKPPAGARVAIIEFEDMQCPDCARANPVLKDAADKYKIPWVRHDFPLPMHQWSFQAAVNARWFDDKGGKKVGDAYRDAIFANQPSFGEDPARMTAFTQQFAKDHGLAYPFAVDPMGKLAAAVKEDYALGQRIGIEHTPTIWVVTSHSKGAPFVEVVDRSKLYQLIDQALEDTKGVK
ncbi:DsbA family protein [Terracidiphilus gabretensis]|jgi:protein-disulfide isomerase|uniref:DsbA family protein n=1 Tax=Terracidiphilus gabretensis TaxID=1577687 RepID=UPI00071BF610|nr:thioredoxin domain-containing protein [Terracidiphilus gabretensis]